MRIIITRERERENQESLSDLHSYRFSRRSCMNFFRLNDNDLPELHLVEQRTDIMDK